MHPVVTRIPKWLWFALALFAGVGAALAFIVYVANGIVAGDLIGVAGREHDIAIAQHRSRVGLLSCIVLQFGVAGGLFGLLDRVPQTVDRCPSPAGRCPWIPTLSILLSAMHRIYALSPECNNGRFATPKHERRGVCKMPEQPLNGANHGRS